MIRSFAVGHETQKSMQNCYGSKVVLSEYPIVMDNDGHHWSTVDKLAHSVAGVSMALLHTFCRPRGAALRCPAQSVPKNA